ncbi:NACHT domain protein [Xylaria sp. FL0933]|nr:NACHT domain protein [Xylaria sp. FL0933]
MAAVFDPVQAAFDNAISDFKAELKDEQIYRELLQITTIDQVYDATDEIQRKQAKQGHLRHLSKVSPYLDRLNEYAATIEVFLQVKPDILALIWGPIKLLLQWTSALRASFDAIVNAMAEVGELLPEFKRVVALFDENTAIQEVMALFFRDILDFYLVALKFFKLSRWKYLFESLWPTHKEKIKVIMTHIQSHGRLMRNEVRLEHIQQEHQARKLALENFERLELERRAQEYHRIKTDIAPQSHDDRLDLLRHLTCQATGTWLLQDATFIKWLGPASQDCKILWLQGIPGAGKTYLASEVIKKAQSMGHTAFAFLSYKQHGTAISVIHSMIFHLASRNEDLQTVVCQSCSEECKKTLEGATDLLVNMLACTGPAYLVVDGLDEMDEVERCRLVAQMLRISASSHEVRLFISSRAEADLVSMLQKDATILQIERRNHQCIQAFVQQWTKSWFMERGFWPEEQSEIELGLESLASKSQGMFLYARVVLDSIKFLDNFDDIRDELHAFPETLEDAYGRILGRINKLDNTLLREKARLILGWVGCSPTALTIQEIQQALSVDLEDSKRSGKVRGNLDLVRICGPIVEHVDSYVQFVHFTVKEYLFSNRVLGFIDLHAATLDLALRCMTYLWQGHHDLNLSDDEIKRNILSGTYTMEWFATNMWPHLAKNYLSSAKHDESQDKLGAGLNVLQIVRTQDQFLGKDDDHEIVSASDHFRKVYPEAYALVRQTLRFHQMCAGSEHRMDPGAPWIELDPLTTSQSAVRINEAISRLLVPNQADEYSHEQTIRRWYGQRPYKCQYMSCCFNRTGFQDIYQVRLHEKHHGRPWKCSFTGCEYADGGFLTEKMRDDHLDRAHSKDTKDTLASAQLESAEETKSLLLDLVKLGCVESVKSYLSRMPNPTDEWASALCQQAVLSGSLQMAQLCRSKCGLHSRYLIELVEPLIQQKNPEIFEWYLFTFIEPKFGKIDISGINSFFYNGLYKTLLYGKLDYIQLWADFIKSNSHEDLGTCAVQGPLRRLKMVKATANDPSREAMLIRLWRSPKWADGRSRNVKDVWGGLLVSVAATTCSVTLARFLIERGADIDFRRNYEYATPLRHAAKQDTAEAAAFMKWMLIHGANPNPEQMQTVRKAIGVKPPVKLRDEKGPSGISKWLGVTWDDLLKEVLKEVQQQRSARISIKNLVH